MTEDLESARREQALHALPLPYSLALRLRAAGTPACAICEYVGIDEAALPGFYRIAEAKFTTELARWSRAPRPSAV